MAKPQPRRIASDDCAVTLPGGEVFYPHEGEWVEVVLGMTVGEIQQLGPIRAIGVQMAEVQGEPDQNARMLELLGPHYEMLTSLLANRILAWNWTDDFGRPLPALDGTPEPLKRLRGEELYWLLMAGQGETSAERKNGLKPSAITSSAITTTVPGATSSVSRRSRTKAS